MLDLPLADNRLINLFLSKTCELQRTPSGVPMRSRGLELDRLVYVVQVFGQIVPDCSVLQKGAAKFACFHRDVASLTGKGWKARVK